MKVKRIFALVCVTLTLLLMSVGVFAFQPPTTSPLVPYGAYQTGNFNSSFTSSVVADFCEVCGAAGYSYVITPPVDISAFYTGSFAVIDVTSLNRNFNGLYTLLDDGHLPSAHKINTAYFNYYDGSSAYVFTTRELTVSNNVRYSALYVPVELSVGSGLADFINDYVTSVTAHTAYSYSIISPSPVQGYLDDMHTEALRLAYNDGQINGSQNADIINGGNRIFEDVRIALTPFLEFEVLGVSVISLVSLLVTFSIIMLIIKVVRG